MRVARPLILAALAILAMVPATSTLASYDPRRPHPEASLVDTVGATTPDLAVRAYIQALAAGDLAALLDATAIDEMAAGYRFDLLTKRLGAWTPSTLPPSDYPLYAAMNREFLESRLLGQTVQLAYSLLSDQPTGEGAGIQMSDAQVDFFLADVDPARLASLELIDSRFPDPKWEHDERAVANAQQTAATYGADEWTERLALVSFDDALYEVGFSLLRYGGEWKVQGQSSAYGNMSVFGAARPTTKELYERHVSGDYSNL